jgi:hypothetical protein
MISDYLNKLGNIPDKKHLHIFIYIYKYLHLFSITIIEFNIDSVFYCSIYSL